jgi:nucleotide-binding universal stress UspA family protein
VLAEHAKGWPADLVVIGTHGRRGFHRLLLGSVAEGFVRVATMPVLLVRDTRAE